MCICSCKETDFLKGHYYPVERRTGFCSRGLTFSESAKPKALYLPLAWFSCLFHLAVKGMNLNDASVLIFPSFFSFFFSPLNIEHTEKNISPPQL